MSVLKTNRRRSGACRAVQRGTPSIGEARTAICLPELGEGRGGFRLFVEGDALFDAMIAAIEAATGSVWMESYIFMGDEVGARFVAALATKARAGLDVRLHLDAFGVGPRNFRQFRHELEQSGALVRWFRPFHLLHPLQFLRRNHRKLLVIDGREAFLGGFNIRRLNSLRLYGETRQRDTHLRVAGRLGNLARDHFERLWFEARPFPADSIPIEVAGLEALLVASHSRRCRHRLACLHAGLFESTRSHIYLTSPYFGPGTVLDRALRAAARRGIDVRLLVPRRSDPLIAGWATRAAYAELLVAGVRIYEYTPRPLHAKTSTVDAIWSIVGSANLDYRSLFVNQELVLVARDRALAEELQVQYLVDLADATEVTLPAWRRRGWHARGFEAIGWVVRRLL